VVAGTGDAGARVVPGGTEGAVVVGNYEAHAKLGGRRVAREI